MRFFTYISLFSGCLISMVLMQSCGKETVSNSLESQLQMVDSYIKFNKLSDSVKVDVNYRYYRFMKGEGVKIEDGDKVTLSYVLNYFESSTKMRVYATNIESVALLNGLKKVGEYTPITVVVGSSGLFKGFDNGLKYLYEGDGALIMFPSIYGYGSSAMGTVAPDTPLGVRVYIHKVEKK